MKKYLKKLLVKSALIVWVCAIVVNAILFKWLDKDVIDILLQLVSSTLVIFMPSLIWWNVLKPRLEYMDSTSMEVPNFSVVRQHKLHHKKGLSIEDLIKALPKRFIVSHIDVEKNKVKFYDKPSFWSWGTGYIMEFRPEEAVVFSFPLSSHPIGVERIREKSIAQLTSCLSL